MTPFTLVGLFTTVHTLVTLQMILLDEAHITYITFKWFLTWPRWKEKFLSGGTHGRDPILGISQKLQFLDT